MLLGAEEEGVFEGRGLLVPYQQARLASRANGVIESIKREGETVREGEAVMLLESEIEKLQVAQQKHILALRQFEWEAGNELNRKKVISQTEVQEKHVNHEVAKVQLAQSEQLLERRKVLAPFDGAVAERLRETGEAVDEFVPILLLVNLKNLYLEVFLPGPLIHKVAIDDPVEVVAEDLEGRTFAGKIAQISPTVNPASGEFKVRILIPNEESEMVAGAYAKARIQTPAAGGEAAPSSETAKTEQTQIPAGTPVP